MTLEETEPGIYLDAGWVPEIDSIIFDCDGVVIDVTESYYAAIRETARHALERFAGVYDGIPIDSEIIAGFKSTGGFNDEVDLAYASILSIAAAKKIGLDQRSLILDVIRHSNGIRSAEGYIQRLADIGVVKRRLAYPGPHAESPLRQIFDQIFYGPDMYRRLFGTDSEFAGAGLIEKDAVLADGGLFDSLQQRFKIAMVTGRGIESAKHSLGGLLAGFDLDSSFFLEDEPRDLAKPNPEPLLLSIRGMDSTRCLYVGDSMEDLIMAGSPRLEGRAAFCGITGTSSNPDEKLRMFERAGARMVLESISLLPKALNLE